MEVVGMRSIGAESANLRRIDKPKIYLNLTNFIGEMVP